MLLIRSKSPIMLGITLWSGVVYPVKFPGIPWHKCAIVLAESSMQIIDISMPGWCIKAWEWCRRVQDFIARNEVTLSGISFRKAEKRESWTEIYMQHWNMATWYTQIARFMGQHGAHLRPTGPRWAPCWPHELAIWVLTSNDIDQACMYMNIRAFIEITAILFHVYEIYTCTK